MNSSTSNASLDAIENPVSKWVDETLERLAREEENKMYAENIEDFLEDYDYEKVEENAKTFTFDYAKAIDDLIQVEEGEVVNYRIVYQVDFSNMRQIKVYTMKVDQYQRFMSSERFSYYESYEFVPSPKKNFSKGNVGKMEDGRDVFVTCHRIYY